MLWKHRDQTANLDTRIVHVEGGTYSYTALANSYHKLNNSAYAGVNEVGFGLISTSTRNLIKECAPTNPPKYEYSLIVEALRECATVDEFEALLKQRIRRAGFQSNIGVGDASGGAAYFEIWGDGYKRYDTAQQASGYDIRTNFSFAGDDNKRGNSTRRYRTVEAQMSKKSCFAVEDFVGFSRSFYSADKGDILASDKTYYDANYTVPRASSVGCIVIVCSETPRMEVIIGHPVAGFSVPVWVAAKHAIPQCVAGRGMFDLSRKFTTMAYTKVGKSNRLNKKVVKKALGVKTKAPNSKHLPDDIASFNAAIDRTFEQHRARLEQVLRLQ